MNQPWINHVLRKRALAGLFAPLVIVACGGASESAQDQGTTLAPVMESGDTQAATASQVNQDGSAGAEAADGDTLAPSHSRTRLYSVVNMGPEAGATALLNERGQAAFGSINADGIRNGFFDGDRLHDIGSLGGGYTWTQALNKHGMVVGESEDDAQPFSNIYAFSWTVNDGMRALAGPSGSTAHDINDKGQIVGRMSIPDISGRAIRWNPNGSVTNLGPLPLSLSEGRAINNQGSSSGYADVLSGAIHATAWDLAGNLTDLQTLGGELAFAFYINESGDVAGVSATETDNVGFFWSARAGLVAIDAVGGGARQVAALNNRGQVAGDTTIDDRSAAYLWSRRRGLVPLPLGTGIQSDVFDLNDQTDMVGSIERPAGEGGGLRAVRWAGLTTPVDLNTQLYRPPAGLVLYAGAAINENGAILAHSNAGLVLLRPGKRGTDAPVLGPVVGLPDAIEVGQQARLSVGFVDNAPKQTHKAVASWSDNCPSSRPVVHESGGTGQVTLLHRFCAPGYVTLKVLVKDSAGRSSEVQRDFLVDSAAFASISGQGTLLRGLGTAGTGNAGLPLRFALWAPIGNSQGSAGSPFVGLYGPFHFRSDQVTTAALAGKLARVEGTGRFNGRAGYRFLIEANDGNRQLPASRDQLRVRITHTDARSGAHVVDFDNGALATVVAARMATRDGTAVVDGGVALRH
jgi:uncharacterized membrane protein